MSDFDLLEACRTRCEDLEARLAAAIERSADLEKVLREARDALLEDDPLALDHGGLYARIDAALVQK